MLGRTLHASGSAFRMLPNPTAYHWEKKSFSMWKILEAYQTRIEDGDIEDNDQISKIKKNLDLIIEARKHSPNLEFSVPTLDALHQSLDDVDYYLTSTVQEYLVVGILRVHFEAVLQLMNDPTGDGPFTELNNATPERRQADFIHIYFNAVRPKVLEMAPRRRFTTLTTPSTALTSLTSPPPPEEGEDPPPLFQRQPTGMEERNTKLLTIWHSLIFRMLCWLLLHDFHKNDVQIPKSELLGSRLPVYIV